MPPVHHNVHCANCNNNEPLRAFSFFFRCHHCDVFFLGLELSTTEQCFWLHSSLRIVYFYSDSEAVLKALKYVKLTALKCLKITAHRRTARRSLWCVECLDEENSLNSVMLKLQNCNLMGWGSQIIKELHLGVFKMYRGRHSFILYVSAKKWWLSLEAQRHLIAHPISKKKF